MSESERLFTLGAKIGSKLIGTDEDDTTVLLIIALDGDRIVAKRIEKNGEIWENGKESNWTLSMRDWKLVE
jgi:hypothetical protein